MNTRTYTIGYLLSLLLTLAAFYLPTGRPVGAELALALLVVLALAQFAIQLVCFLHLGREKSPRWNLIAFVFALFVVAVVVGGSLWIMGHLEHRLQDTSDVW